MTVKPSAGLRTVDFHGIAIVDGDLTAVVEEIQKCIDSRKETHVLALNPQVYLEATRDPKLMDCFRRAEVVLADGIGIAISGGVRENRFPKQYSGIDVMLSLCERAALRGQRVCLVGGVDGIAALSAQSLQKRYPGLVVAGTFEPPFSEKMDDLFTEDLTRRIQQVRPDLVFVGLGAPKQEMWIDRSRGNLHVPLMMGVGGSFDIVSARLRRAPRWVRAAGLEWLFRLLQEPRRLARRYLVGIPHFLAVMLYRALFHRKKGTS